MRKLFTPIKLAVHNLRSNVARTTFTLLGVVIGITSVILVTSTGDGVKSYILGQIESFGTDVIQAEVKIPAVGKNSSTNATSQAMGVQITTLTVSDAEAIKKLPNVREVYAGTIGQEIVNYLGTNKRVLLFGAGAGVPEVDPGVKIAEGNFYSEAEDNSLAQVVVLGSDVKDSLFGDESAIGKEVRIKGQNYKVVGTLVPRGSVTFFNLDDLMYVPVQTLQKKILGVNYVRSITVRVEDENLLDVTGEDMTDLLRRKHNINDPLKDDFSVTSIKEAQETISDVFGTINILLLALTSISLIVGGVGIMNVMYVAVTERTFEIGLRKSVGARAGDILRQFLWEAVFITFLGGVAGIILGFILIKIITLVFSGLGFDLIFSLTWGSVFLATAFSMATGIIFGYYPAKKAASLTPVEALRKE